MKLTSLKITDLITPDAKLTFLVGAGCSVDPPSNLPAGKTMMEALIKYACVETEIDKLLGNADLEEGGRLEGLRFEQLIEIIRDQLDPELRIIDFYGLCDKPNIQHFFLAEMMKQGQFMLTTNFDFLIEYALQHSGVPKEDIKVVITKEDFKSAKNPQELFSNGIKTLYKIHGSTQNIITEKSTRDSLIATIQAFGANKEGENVFQLESFKQPAFVKLTKNRSLVVIGYSGSDDFDIVPTLKILKHIEDIIWINYIHDDGGKESIYEIESKDLDGYENLPKVNQILVDIKRTNYTKGVLRVDVNTSRMVRELLPTQIKEELPFSIHLHKWLKNNIKLPDKLMRLYISYRIYFDFDIYKDALSILKKLLKLAECDGKLGWKALGLNDIGGIYYSQGNYPEALKCYEEVLQINEQLGDLRGKAASLNNIGEIFRAQGNYPEALKHYEEALQIDEQLGDLRGKATRLNNIGGIHYAQGTYPEALKCYEEALQIGEQLGDLSGKAICLNNIGLIYDAQGKSPEALKCYEQALQIDEQLGDLSGKATDLNNIGMIYVAQENYPEALKCYEEALQIDEQLGDLSGKATRLNNIGGIHDAQGNYPEALKRYKEALKIDEQLGNLSGKATDLNNIARTLYEQKNYKRALEFLEEALGILNKLGLSNSSKAQNYKYGIELIKKALDG